MDSVPELPGTAGLVLAGNVVPLDPEPAVLAAMLEGWGRQQRARFLQDRTIAARARLVRRLAEFSGQYPWQWNAAEIEAFFPPAFPALTARQLPPRRFGDLPDNREISQAARRRRNQRRLR